MQFLIFNTLELDLFSSNDLNQVSNHIVRTTIDGSKTLISWEGDNPGYLNQLNGTEGPYDESEIENILTGSIWVDS